MVPVASPPPRLPSLSPAGSRSTEHSSAGYTAFNSTESPASRVNGVNFYHEKETFNDMSEVDHRRGMSGGPPVYEKVNGHSDHTSRKRKGSSSYDAMEPVTRYDYSPPRRHDPPHQVADRVLNVLEDSKDSGDTNHARARNSIGSRTDIEQLRPDNVHSRGDKSNRSDNADTRMAEALQQATHEEDSATVESPTDDKGSADGNSPDQMDALTSTTTNGKRKRMFSNRTKTGCRTCRRRKKKCDERHPHCNNCSRGGFPCEGYTNSQETSWRLTDQRTSILSQGNEGFQEVQNGIYQPKVTPMDQAPVGFTRPEQQPHALPIEENNTAGAQLTLSPQSAESRSRGSYSGHSWPPQHGHAPYNHHSGDHLPPFSEMASRPDIPRPDYSHAPPSRDMSRFPPPQSATQPPGQWQTHPGSAPPPQDYRPTYVPQRVETVIAQPHMPPRPSMSGHSGPGKMSFGAHEVERSKMLRRAHYSPFDATLENERQRCEEASRRYNAACSPMSGVSREGAEDMLRKIFDPALDTTHRMVAQYEKKGLLGPGVRIEAPFSCTYGYNISIYDNAFIGKGCELDDAGVIRIGARTWIGPNVTIFTNDLASKDLIDRRGAESKWIANPVNIGDEVVIGRNVVIYPGVTIGRGSMVEPGAVVKTSVGDNQIVVACGGQIRAA